jgi:undecaprenyl-diphosphatase
VLELVVLGIVQGLTEFLPVSSTAHLLFAEHYLGIRRPGLALEGVLHLGTAIAAVLVLWPTVTRLIRAGVGLIVRPGAPEGVDPQVPLVKAIIAATVVTAAIGLAFRDPLEGMFTSVRATALQLMLTGLILLAQRERGQRSAATLTIRDGVALGLAQAIAIVPGISRSGTTIVGALRLGFERVEATRLSFLMAIPAILGASLFTLKDAGRAAQLGYTPLQLLVGGLVAGVVGAASMAWLIGLVQRRRLIVFSAYCWLVGALVFFTTR